MSVSPTASSSSSPAGVVFAPDAVKAAAYYRLALDLVEMGALPAGLASRLFFVFAASAASLANAAAGRGICDVVSDCGAVADNSTDASSAITNCARGPLAAAGGWGREAGLGGGGQLWVGDVPMLTWALSGE